jgi:hypothetical protein
MAWLLHIYYVQSTFELSAGSGINRGVNMKRAYGLIIGLSITLMLSAIDASAWRGGGGRSGGGFYHGNHNYYGWGVPYWYDVPSGGVFVASLPDGYTRVLVDGSTYYYANGYYLMPYSSGYMVVAEPENAIAAAPAELAPDQTQGLNSEIQPMRPKTTTHDTTTINVPNSKGGFTQVTLVKHKNGYVGPQGEFYANHPTVDELKALYGN